MNEGKNEKTAKEGTGDRGSFRHSYPNCTLITVLIAWFVFLFAIFAIKIPPIDTIVRSYADIFFFISILACSYAIGTFFTGVPLHRGFRFADLSELHVISTGIGLWVFSLIAVLLSFSGFVKRPIVITLLCVMLVFFLAYIRLCRKRAGISSEAVPESGGCLEAPEEHGSAARHTLFEMSLAACLLFIIVLAFFFFVRPPIHYDSLEYHLPIPSEIIKQNAFPYFPLDVHSNFPLTVEMLYLLSLVLTGWKLANLLNFCFLPLMILMVYLFTRRVSGRSAALVSASVLASTYTVIELATHPLVDLQFAFFTAASLILLMLWLERNENKYFYISALLTGVALGIKYTAFLFTIPLNILFLALFIVIRRERLHLGIIRVCIYIILIVAVASPWLIRNYVNTGNPVFPIAAEWMGSEKWSNEQAHLLHKAANESPRDLSEIPKFPFRMSFSRSDFGSFSWIGPVYLMFLPLILLYRKERMDYILILYAILYFLLWSFSFTMMRFTVPLLVALSILAGRAVQRSVLAGESHIFRRALLFFTVLAVVFNILYFVASETQITGNVRTIFGGEDEEIFLSEQLPYYDAIDVYNRIADERSTILFLGETRTFYCRGKVVWSSAYNENPIVPVVRASRSPSDIAAKLRSLGFTHLLYSPSEMIRINRNYKAYDFNDEETKRFISFLTAEATVLFSRNHVYLLRIRSSE